MFVYILFCDVGFYMEPEIEIIGVFSKKKYATQCLNIKKNKNHSRFSYWIEKHKVIERM